MTERVFEQIKTAFLEDVAVFTAQQRMISLKPEASQVDINADAGGIQARRIVDRLYREEQAPRRRMPRRRNSEQSAKWR